MISHTIFNIVVTFAGNFWYRIAYFFDFFNVIIVFLVNVEVFEFFYLLRTGPTKIWHLIQNTDADLCQTLDCVLNWICRLSFYIDTLYIEGFFIIADVKTSK